MKFYIRTFSFVTALLLSFTIFGQGIQFEESTWQDALAKAKKANKLLFVDSYAKWCGPCKRMAKHEFVKKDVGDIYNGNFINLKLDMETKNGRTFDSQYPVSAYPTMFFLDGDGKVVKKVRGGKKGEQLIALAKDVLKSHDTSGQWKEKYDEGDRSFDVVYNYVSALNKSSKPSLKISNDYLNSSPDISEEEMYKFVYVATVEADSRIFDMLTENKKQIVTLLGEEAYNKKVNEAIKNTIVKAVEYESEMLLNEAIDKCSNLTQDENICKYENQLFFAEEMNNDQNFLTASKSLSKEYFKTDPKKVGVLIKNMQNSWHKNEDIMEYSYDLAKKLYKKDASIDHIMIYCKSLMIQEDFDKAEKVIEKELKKMEKDEDNKKDIKQLKMLQNILEKKKA